MRTDPRRKRRVEIGLGEAALDIIDYPDGLRVRDGDLVGRDADEGSVFLVQGPLGMLGFAAEDAAGEPEAGEGGKEGAGDVGVGVEEAGVEEPAEGVESEGAEEEGGEGLLLDSC